MLEMQFGKCFVLAAHLLLPLLNVKLSLNPLTSSLHAVLTDCMAMRLNQHTQLRELSCRILTQMRAKQLHPVVYVETFKFARHCSQQWARVRDHSF